jgi:aspartate aminotransferase
MVAEFRVRRDEMVQGLNALPGVRCFQPRGAFYAFPNVAGTGLGSRDLAERLLVDAGVAVLSGTAFGEYGEGYLRLSYAASLEQIEEALAAMETTLGSCQPTQEGAGDAADRGEALRPSHQ